MFIDSVGQSVIMIVESSDFSVIAIQMSTQEEISKS